MIRKRNYEAHANAFRAWWSRAKEGETLVYYTGLLASDRLTDPYLAALTATIQDMYERGAVILTQRRLGDANFQYLARKEFPTRYQAEVLKKRALHQERKLQGGRS